MEKPGAPPAPHETASPSGGSDDLNLRFRILNAEYSHLTSMLTSTWSITGARTNLFFVAVSAAGVALALLANGLRAGSTFLVLALAILLLVLFMGVVAQTRLLHANREAATYLQSLNRIRHFFVEMDPGSERYMALPTTDDDIGLFGSHAHGSSFGAMTQMPAASMATLVALIDAFVAAAITGIVFLLVSGGSQLDAVIAAGIALAVALAGFEGWAYVDLQGLRRSLDVRFPTARRAGRRA